MLLSSYNYERFLAAAIDGARQQTHGDIISRYGKNVIAILKENGGQASALNAGYRKSRGELVSFLDSDDILFPTALGSACALADEATANVHGPLARIDAHDSIWGAASRRTPCRRQLPRRAARPRPCGVLGAADLRKRMEPSLPRAVMPIPEPEYRVAADAYLLALSPLRRRGRGARAADRLPAARQQ